MLATTWADETVTISRQYNSSSDNNPEDIEILIRFKRDVHQARQRAFSEAFFFKTICRYNRFRVQRCLIESAGKIPVENILSSLRSDPRVEWAEPNYSRYPQKLPDDPMFDSQWHLKNTGQSGGIPGADIQAVQAWDITAGNSDVVVAVLDSGINYSHPDIQKNMWQNLGEDWKSGGIPGNNGVDDDNNGYIDDYYGINAANGDGDPMDRWGHGSHVAGIIGAVSNNGIGVSGINWQTQLMALNFLDPEGSVADELECISYILDQIDRGVPVRVVNASFGGSDFSVFEKEAIESLKSAGVMMAASAGNDGTVQDGVNTNYPACYDLENIISVAATDNKDTLASFSNYGFYSVDVGAPGVKILSTYLSESYTSMSGTSMSAPQVSGALALLFATGTPSIMEARERILRGVDQNKYLYGQVFSNGRLNLFKVLTVKLQGPFVFNISPISGSPGSKITITGVRFGNGDSSESYVTFKDLEMEVLSWNDNRIVCFIPDDIDFSLNSAEGVSIRVHNHFGVSNAVFFDIDPYQYFLPFSPSDSTWTSYLLLCNYGLETVSPRIFAGPSNAYVIEPHTEILYPWQMTCKNLKDYDLSGEKNLLWVESKKDISVSILVINTRLGEFTLIPAKHR